MSARLCKKNPQLCTKCVVVVEKLGDLEDPFHGIVTVEMQELELEVGLVMGVGRGWDWWDFREGSRL